MMRKQERVLEVEVEGLPVYVIGIDDLILDRVRGYDATGSRLDFEWAVNLAAVRWEALDQAYLAAEAETRRVRAAAEQVLSEAKQRLEKLERHEAEPRKPV